MKGCAQKIARSEKEKKILESRCKVVCLKPLCDTLRASVDNVQFSEMLSAVRK